MEMVLLFVFSVSYLDSIFSLAILASPHKYSTLKIICWWFAALLIKYAGLTFQTVYSTQNDQRMTGHILKYSTVQYCRTTVLYPITKGSVETWGPIEEREKLQGPKNTGQELQQMTGHILKYCTVHRAPTVLVRSNRRAGKISGPTDTVTGQELKKSQCGVTNW
jgi:hypothetical protein